jgi:hypothetical protein
MGRSSFVLLSLTAIVAGLAAALAFVVLRLFAAARELNRTQHGAGAETAFMAAAMEEAVAKLRSASRRWSLAPRRRSVSATRSSPI